MLNAYRRWLESEQKTLGNAAHHAYSFGQANMAKRAIEHLDQALSGSVVLELAAGTAREALVDLRALGASTPALEALTQALRQALHAEG
ncbi:hypothetical protein EPN52_13280 [bacterium]|nr:MAG: hypothetical protein EPN52_13280 [bacterium]